MAQAGTKSLEQVHDGETMTDSHSIVTAVAEAKALALSGDMEASNRTLAGLLNDGHALEVIKAALTAADPERIVWRGSISPDAIGLRGLPLVEPLYQFCSDIYGHRIVLPAGEWDAAFVDACEAGYENGTLHDKGNVVIDKAANRVSFLVVVALDADDDITPDSLAAISSRWGVDARLLAWSHEPLEAGGRPGFVCATALVSDLNKLGSVPGISEDFIEGLRQHEASPGQKL
jgi:hypothetical protein